MIFATIRTRLPEVRAGWVSPVLLAAAVFVVALSALTLTREAGRIAAIWPSNALLVAVLLTRPRSEWAGLIAAGFLGNMAANAASGDLLATSLLLASANTLEVMVVAFVAGGRRRLRLRRRSGLARFVLAVALGCLASTAFAQLGLFLTGGRPSLESAGLWLTADSLGLLIFTPLLIRMFDGRAARPSRLARDDLRELWIPLLALVVLTMATFSQTSLPLLFLPVAGLALVAASAGFSGGALGVVSIGAVVLILSPNGWGPMELIPGDITAKVIFLQLYLLVLTAISMIVGSISSERRRLIRRLTQARSARRDGDARVRRLLNQSRLAEQMAHVGYWTMDARTGAAFWSPEVYRIHGVNRDFQITVEAALEFYMPEDRERFREAARRSRLTGEGWEIDATIVRRSDGQHRLIRCLAHVERAPDGSVAGFFGVLKDLTDERRAAAAAAERDSRYRLLADNASDVIALYGADSIFRYVSPAVTELLGYEPDELIGRSTYEIVHPDDRTAVAAAFARAAREQDPAKIEYRACARDGSIRWLEARPRFKRGPEGRIVEIHDCVRDVSDRREREVALAAARQAAEQAAEAKSRFLATMSHEIRTPLHGVLGFADVLARSKLTAEQAHYVDRIRSAGGSLAALIDDILDFSRIEAGRMPVETRAYDLRLLVNEVVEMASATASHLAFVVNQSPEVEDWVLGDPLRVRQVLTNLIGNAAKFTLSGTIRVTIEQADRRLRFQVADDGIGLSPGLQDKVFDPFVQADATVSRRFGGTGLGLTISRSLARLMGGDVTLENGREKGAVSTLELPYAPTPNPGAAGESAEVGARRRLRVLVVDDADMNLELMRLMLSEAGHHAVEAASGADAIRMVREEGPFDLVLMDLQMPDMDGLAATRMIRALEGPASSTPIIALTADAQPETVRACREAGMDAHLSKPLRPDELFARLGRVEFGQASDAFDVLRLRYRMRMAAEADGLEQFLLDEPPASLAALREMAHRIAGAAGSLGFDSVARAAVALCDQIREGDAVGAMAATEALRVLIGEMRSA